MSSKINYMDIDYILLDFAGTIVTYEPSTMDIVYDFLTKLGCIKDHNELGALIYKTNYILCNKLGINYYTSDDIFWHTAISLLKGHLIESFSGVAEELVDVLRKFRKSGQFDVRIDFNALDLISSTGIQMALLSNWAPTLPQYCEELGVARYFRFILASEGIGIAKPNPAAFHFAVRKTGLSLSQVMYIGDNYYIDYVGATHAGLCALLIDDKGWYQKFNCNKINSLSEVLNFIRGK